MTQPKQTTTSGAKPARRPSRFLASVIAASQDSQIDLPWARGARRAAMIARRQAAEGRRQSA